MLCRLAVQLARADTVLVSSTSLVIGSQSTVYSFQATGAGTMVAQVTNVDWPQLLSSLSFTAGSANHVMSSWSDPGSQLSATLSFNVSGPGMYFADILATAGGPLDLGVYSLSIKFLPATAPVPLPAPAWLLLAGLAALLARWRTASRRPAIADRSDIPALQGA
jgi:hypothetical protein